ncbi:hypothetical protein EMCRGX_G031048 [Ephydatia muelleri]
MDLPTKQGRIQIGGKQLDVVCTKFGTTLFIFISEFQKIGTLLEVTADAVLHQPHSKFIFSVKTLLGKDDDLTHTIGRSIAGHITEQMRQPGRILLALGLKTNPDPSTLSQILTKLDSFSVWSELSS